MFRLLSMSVECPRCEKSFTIPNPQHTLKLEIRINTEEGRRTSAHGVLCPYCKTEGSIHNPRQTDVSIGTKHQDPDQECARS